ncbi:MAG: LamG-like jellyroll fold domain-containing protein, partial [Prolixibacteraceae bacterium]
MKKKTKTQPMKVAGISFCACRKLVSFMLIVLFSAIQGMANNPDVSNYLKNLSSSINSGAYDDIMPEMVIQGNSIHVAWIEYVSGSENYIYYCRSTDLGKTWETPLKLAMIKNGQYARHPRSRKLAVDGNSVHIAFCDYDYANKGTAHIYHTVSTDNGGTFGAIQDLVNTGGNYKDIAGSHIKASGGKVAILYKGTGTVNGLHMLFSGNGGGSFTDTAITTDPDNFSDFWYDGNQMIVLSDAQWYNNGLTKGLVYVSISNDGAATFSTQKISLSYNSSPTVISEKCISNQYQHYVPKIAKSGNSIHIVMTGNNENIEWTTFYVRSTNNGVSFETAKDINKGVLSGGNLGTGQETLVAKNGHVYIMYIRASTNNYNQPIYLAQSSDDGSNFSVAHNILPEGFSYLDKTWFPGLLLDPADPSGKVIFFYGSHMYSAKSTDGGLTFGENLESAPFLGSLIINKAYTISDLKIDTNGEKHWISNAEWRGGTDSDIMYKHIPKQPEPGSINKALYLETTYSPQKMETVVVPPSPSLDFDSAMTAEAWVKFDKSTVDITNILAKVNGYDGWDSDPDGYQMSFRYNKGKMGLTAGIETDKGDFVIMGEYTIGDTLWHHVAFTYDASAGLNNFKTYVDGLLSVQKTVTGKIKPGNGMLMIGTRGSFIRNAQYQIDNLRLWNRALPQTELLKNQKEEFSGNEDGLKLFLNFDDTFKDISGNGNDGVPLYLGDLRTSDFDPPVSDFDLYKSGNQISLTNKTKNGTSFLWKYGDGKTSELGNPVYTYPTPGEYNVVLESVNANSKTTAVKSVSIAGLDRIEPTQAGNGGYATITVFGGALTVANTSLSLRRTGESDVVGE